MQPSSVKHENASQRGMGLIEILIAVLLVGLAVLALGRMIQTTSESASQSKTRSEALAIAQKQLEALRDFPTYADYNTDIVSSTAATITFPMGVRVSKSPCRVTRSVSTGALGSEKS